MRRRSESVKRTVVDLSFWTFINQLFYGSKPRRFVAREQRRPLVDTYSLSARYRSAEKIREYRMHVKQSVV